MSWETEERLSAYRGDFTRDSAGQAAITAAEAVNAYITEPNRERYAQAISSVNTLARLCADMRDAIVKESGDPREL